MDIVQQFNWHSEAGAYRFGEQGYLVMDGQSHEGAQCARRLINPINNPHEEIELILRVVVGKRFAIRLYDSTDRLGVELLITEEGWLQFTHHDSSISTDCYLTWFSGRPVVDPDFVPHRGMAGSKTIESDEHSIRFGNFSFEASRFSFSFDGRCCGEYPVGQANDIARLEMVAFPSQEPGNRLRLKAFRHTDGDQVREHETFPIYWEPIDAVPAGYPDDNTLVAVTRPYGYHWLQCSGRYCWVKGHLPNALDAAEHELTFDLRTTDVGKETCVELHQEDGTMAQSMLPVKVGIIQGAFFSGFASRVTSSLLGREFWKSQQALYPQVIPQPNTTYAIRIRWSHEGYYRWWVNDTPMEFSGVAKTGMAFDFPGYETPGYKIPFLNELITKPFTGFDTIALHYGLVSPAEHVAYYGNFRITDHADGGW